MGVPLPLRVLRSIILEGEHRVRHHVFVQKWRSVGVHISRQASVTVGHNRFLEIRPGSSHNHIPLSYAFSSLMRKHGRELARGPARQHNWGKCSKIQTASPLAPELWTTLLTQYKHP
jgi:hypothetical protein